MNTRTKLILATTIIAVAAGCGREKKTVETTATKPAVKAAIADVYYCPMHPTVQRDQPGSCPICGMTLVKRAGASAHDTTHGAAAGVAAVSLSPEQRVTANVQTLRVELATGSGDVVTTGRVTFDERRVAQISSYTAGRIERLYVNFTGDTVRRGEAVAAIWSPDLFATQQEYLLALNNRARMQRAGFADARSASEDLVVSTRRRLLIFGMSEGQVRQLERGGKPITATTIVAPVSGVVTKKLVVPQQYVMQGQPLLELADLTNVWVEADVYEQQLPNVKIGQRVVITSPAIPGVEFNGTVSFIQPVLTGETRTAPVRIDLANPKLQLKPDMYVSVRVSGGEVGEHIMIPASAVIDRGQKQFVWVEVSPGTYEPREVRIGPRHGEYTVIASGIHAGDVIVTAGGFLLDSEAQLRGITAGGHEH
jgi:Cu(I)/Ag(I) efflux system membrane fusion protein